MALNSDTLKGEWKQIRGEVKKKWGTLTEDDLAFADGNTDQLIGKIQQRTGEARDAVERYISSLMGDGSSKLFESAESARQLANRAQDQLRDGYRQAEDIVRHNPGQAAGVVFGSGLLVGIFVGLALRR